MLFFFLKLIISLLQRLQGSNRYICHHFSLVNQVQSITILVLLPRNLMLSSGARPGLQGICVHHSLQGAGILLEVQYQHLRN